LSSNGRIDALLDGKKVDRVPVMSFALGFCAEYGQCQLREIYANSKASFEAQLHTRERFCYDSDPFYGYASYGAWEFGGGVRFPESEYEQAPSIDARRPIELEEEVASLQLPDVKKAGALPIALRFSRLQRKAGMRASVVTGGPFTVAVNLCSEARLCRWMLKKPELVHQLLQKTAAHIVDVVKYWVSVFGPEYVLPQLWEPAASNQIISPRQFEQFVYPYQKEVHEKIVDIGVQHIFCHICGDQRQNLCMWAEIPMGAPGIVSFGHEVDLKETLRYFGESCIVAGNIQPAVLQMGTPAQIKELCSKAIAKAKGAPLGFVLMPGCELPVQTPCDNVHAMVQAADQDGRYR
jgi:uroporphyrinogen decarboxylase